MAEQMSPLAISPSPWECIPATEHHGAYVVNEYGGTVCDLYIISDPTTFSDSVPVPFTDADANAHLIAAAPTLYEAAEAALELAVVAEDFTGCRGDDDFIWGLQAKLRAALALARGESPK